MRLFNKYDRMSWANLTKKLSRSRSHSTWSIKSNKSPTLNGLNEDAVSQISTVIGILLSTPWAKKICMPSTIHQVLKEDFWTTLNSILVFQVELCPRTTRHPDTVSNGPKPWSPSLPLTSKAQQWSTDKWKNWKSPTTVANISFSFSIPWRSPLSVPRRS